MPPWAAHRGHGTFAYTVASRQGTSRVPVPALGMGTGWQKPYQQITGCPGFPRSPCPPTSPALPAHAFAWGLAGREATRVQGPEAGGGGGGDTGWSESKPGICRMSPYPDSLCFLVSISTVLLQPPAGGWQGAPLGRRRARRSLAARLPLARRNLPFPSLARPWGARPRAINRGAGAHRYSSSHLGCAWEMGGR